MPPQTPTAPAESGNPENAAEIAAIHARLDAGDERMARIEAALAENTKVTKATADSTAELVSLFMLGKGAIKGLEFLGKLAKPLAAIFGLGAAVASAWVAFKAVGR